MNNFDKPISPEQKNEFLEESVLLDKAREKYLELERGEIDANDLDEWLKSENGFLLQDKESFNCHSFLLAVMKNDLSMSNVETFKDVSIDADKWKDEDGYMDSELNQLYVEHVTENFPSESEAGMKKLRVFQENILANAKKFPLKILENELKSTRDETMKDAIKADEQGIMSDKEYDELCDRADEKHRELVEKFTSTKKKKIKEYSKKILEDIINNNLSRFAFIFDESENAQLSHRDNHSFVILGENSARDDVAIIEKKGPGESIRINNLSEVIEHYLGQNLTLNIPTKNVTELYPD
jgi:hypothetical protein